MITQPPRPLPPVDAQHRSALGSVAVVITAPISTATIPDLRRHVETGAAVGPGRPWRAEGWRHGQADGSTAHVPEPFGPAPEPGLVPCAISVREHEQPNDHENAIWRPAFPGPELVGAAADLIPHIRDDGGRDSLMREGPRWQIVVSPGVIRVQTRDLARAERTRERAAEARRHEIDMRVTWSTNGQDAPEPLPTRGTIFAWSPKSRARMVARLSDLDYNRLYGQYRICSDCGTDYADHRFACPGCRSPRFVAVDRSNRLPAMITLTYPGDWLTVAPTAESAKRHFWALCKRYERAWGEPLIGPWKQEFQRRGAPHMHLSTTPPMGFTSINDPHTGQPRLVDFRQWLSITWADIVAHPDPEQRRRHLVAGTGVDYAEGIKLTDPRRMAVYFAKYGAAGPKEYQHRVPREWLTTSLICDDCGREFEEDRDECPECGSLNAQVLDTVGAGRFWGYRGLRPALAVRDVTPDVGIAAGRIMRRWYRSKQLTKKVMRARVEQETGRVRYRRTTVRTRLFAHGRGFATVNDGPAFASQLARHLAAL